MTDKFKKILSSLDGTYLDFKDLMVETGKSQEKAVMLVDKKYEIDREWLSKVSEQSERFSNYVFELIENQDELDEFGEYIRKNMPLFYQGLYLNSHKILTYVF